MTQKPLRAEGMTCQHCVQTITNSLKGKTGVKMVGINIDKKEVKIEYDKEKLLWKKYLVKLLR